MQVNENDGLPCKLCQKCIKRLTIAIEFRHQCYESYEYFVNFVKHVNSTFEKVKTFHN